MRSSDGSAGLSGHRYAWRREYLETHLSAIDELEHVRIAGLDDLDIILEAAACFHEIPKHIAALEELAETDLSPQLQEHPYPQNEFKRIRELAVSTASQLEKVADQISWGRPPDRQFAQVRRNLYPMRQLMTKTIVWLNGMVQ